MGQDLFPCGTAPLFRGFTQWSSHVIIGAFRSTQNQGKKRQAMHPNAGLVPVVRDALDSQTEGLVVLLPNMVCLRLLRHTPHRNKEEATTISASEDILCISPVGFMKHQGVSFLRGSNR